MQYLSIRFTFRRALMKKWTSSVKTYGFGRLFGKFPDLQKTGKPVIVRIRDVCQIDEALFAGADILYLGGSMMTNRTLLDEVGRLEYASSVV